MFCLTLKLTNRLEIRLRKARPHNRTKPVRVVIADDHPIVRAGIKAIIKNIKDVVVIGEASNGKEALERVEELKPSVMLLDITMPEGSGFEVLRHVSKNFPEIRVIVLTVHDAKEYAIEALREGAVGFLPKSAASTELEQAIQAVSRGEGYMSPKALVAPGEDTGTTKRELLDKLDKLSPRQREVLRLIAEGRTTKQIAHMLKISVKTVETHRAQLMDRLGIHDVAGLVRYAIIVGLIDVE